MVISLLHLEELPVIPNVSSIVLFMLLLLMNIIVSTSPLHSISTKRDSQMDKKLVLLNH